MIENLVIFIRVDCLIYTQHPNRHCQPAPCRRLTHPPTMPRLQCVCVCVCV